MKSHSEQLDDLQNLHQQISKQRELLKVDQAYLDNAPLALKEAVAHLEQSKADKAVIDATILVRKATIVTLRQDKIDQIDIVTHKYDTAVHKLKLLEAKEAPIRIKITAATKELESIVSENATRKTYLKEQETLITHMMEEANISIADAHSKYSQLERSIAGLIINKSNIESDIQTLVLDKNIIEGNTAIAQENNELAFKVAQGLLKEVADKTEASKVKYLLMVDDIEKRKSELHAEVEAIDAKREALFNETKEYQTIKRRSIPMEDYTL